MRHHVSQLTDAEKSLSVATDLLETGEYEGWTVRATRKQRVVVVDGMSNEVTSSRGGLVLHAFLLQRIDAGIYLML